MRLLEEGIPGARDKAAGVLGFLCVGNGLIRVTIAAAGALGPMVQHLVEGSPKGKEYAVGALRNMALDQENRRAMVKDLNALPLIVDLLKHGLPAAQEQAAWTLFNISQDDGACFQVRDCPILSQWVCVWGGGGSCNDILCGNGFVSRRKFKYFKTTTFGTLSYCVTSVVPIIGSARLLIRMITIWTFENASR